MSNQDHINSFDDFFDSVGYRFEESFSDGWDSITQTLKSVYDKTTDKLGSELSLPVAQTYVNDALQKFVTDNVGAILELRVD